MADLEALEEEARQNTLKVQFANLGIVNRHLGLYAKTLNTLNGKVDPDDQLGRALLLLGSRSFNSLRCAYDNLQMGYYAQAIILTRSALEDWLTLEDCRTEESTLTKLFKRGERMPRFSEMADRLDSEKQAFWKDIEGHEGIYGLLSSISHPRYRALLFATNPETTLLRVGPDYFDEHFNVTSHHILMAISNHLHVLVEMAGTEAEFLRDEIEEAMREGLEELKRLLRWAKSRIEGE